MKFTVTKVVSEPTNKTIPYQYVATFIGSIVIICTGMIFAWATPSLPILLSPDSPIPITQSDGSWLAVMPCISAVVGCFAAAYMVDKIGRKASMLISSPLYFLAWILIGFAESVAVYYCARFISGIADGIAFTVFPMYLGEIADSKIRGLLCSYIPITTIIGFLLISLIGSFLSISTTGFISSSLPIVHFILFSFMPESPYFLLMKGKGEKAKNMLIKLRGHCEVEEEFNRLEQAVQEQSIVKTSVWDLFTVESNRKGVYIVVGLRGLQQFCGTMAITFYATIIFKESGSTLSASTCTIIYFGIQVLCGVICSILVDKVGRRPLLLLSTIGSCMALAVEGIYFYVRDYTSVDTSNYSFIPVVALLSFNIIFNLGIGIIPVMMLGELFPTNVKAFALCLADIYFGLVVIIVAKFFQIMKDEFGMHVPFIAFSGFCAVCFVYIYFYIPETKGKTLEEIQDDFKRNKSDNKKSVN